MSIEEINELIKREKELGNSVKDVSDGHHTFRSLYENRLILFATICNCFPSLAWKSKKHFDEENDPMFEGDFIVGINTPLGVATYHFKLENWDLFQIPELPRAVKYDNYSNEDVMKRIYSLSKSKMKL